MNDRIVRYAVRGLVIAVAACVIVATWASRVVLSHGSGTFYALLVYLPILAAPGLLAWQRPTARMLALWSAIGWIASFVHQLVGRPYRYELVLAGWSYIATPVVIAMALVLLVTPVLAFMIAANARRDTDPPPERALLARRLRRIVQLAAVLGLVAIGAGFVPTPYTGWDATVFVALYTILMLVPGALVWRDPRRAWAWLWTAWALPFAVILTFMSSSVVELPASWKVLSAALGTANVLLVVVMPIVCMTTRDRVESVPAARMR